MSTEAARPRATMTVEVRPELPDDFAQTVQRAVREAAAAGLIREGVSMISLRLYPDQPQLPPDVVDALGVLFRYAESLSPERPAS